MYVQSERLYKLVVPLSLSSYLGFQEYVGKRLILLGRSAFLHIGNFIQSDLASVAQSSHFGLNPLPIKANASFPIGSNRCSIKFFICIWLTLGLNFVTWFSFTFGAHVLPKVGAWNSQCRANEGGSQNLSYKAWQAIQWNCYSCVKITQVCEQSSFTLSFRFNLTPKMQTSDKTQSSVMKPVSFDVLLWD